MKQIKLAVLAVCLLTGIVGAYGQTKKAVFFYWASPLTPKSATQVIVATGAPSPSCIGSASFSYICRFSSEEELQPNDAAWVSEVGIVSTYGN